MKTKLTYEELNEKLRSYERILKEAKDKELIKNYKEYIWQIMSLCLWNNERFKEQDKYITEFVKSLDYDIFKE